MHILCTHNIQYFDIYKDLHFVHINILYTYNAHIQSAHVYTRKPVKDEHCLYTQAMQG